MVVLLLLDMEKKSVAKEFTWPGLPFCWSPPLDTGCAKMLLIVHDSSHSGRNLHVYRKSELLVRSDTGGLARKQVNR